MRIALLSILEPMDPPVPEILKTFLPVRVRIQETLGESNGSSRDFLVHNGPNWDSTIPVDVVIKLRDDKGATHLFGGATSACRRLGRKPPLAIGRFASITVD